MTVEKNARRLILAHLMLCTAIGVGGLAATAEPVMAQASATVHRFAIAAQPLETALAQFSRQTGLHFAYQTALGRGKTSQGVSGNLSALQALERLIAGSGLRVEQIDGSTVTLVGTQGAAAPSDQEGVVQLGQVTLTGGRHEATEGYIARSSVSGTKTATPLAETPQAINVITHGEIRDRAPTRLAEVLRYTPAVVTEVQNSTSYFDRIRVRGFYSVNNFYLNGMQMTPGGTAAVAQIDPQHLERLEVIKGPASVLYGQNGAGGLINQSLKRAGGETFTEIGTKVGNKGLGELSFDANRVLDAQAGLSARMTGKVSGSKTDITGNGLARGSLAGSVLWEPSETTSLLGYFGAQRDGDGSAGSMMPLKGTLAPGDNGLYLPRDTQMSDPNYANYSRDQAYVGVEFDHEVSEGLKYHFGARWIYVAPDYDSIGAANTAQLGSEAISRRLTRSQAMSHGLSLDNNLSFSAKTGDISHDLLVGVDWRRFKYNAFADQGNILGLFNSYAPTQGGLEFGPFAVSSNSRSSQTQKGVYLQDQMSFGNWRAVASLRKDWAESFENDLKAGEITLQKDAALTGRLGLMHIGENGFSPYVSYSTSFEPQSGTDAQGRPFDPTEGKQWELGVKYEPTGFDGSFSASLYDLRRTNILTDDPNSSDRNHKVQTGEIGVKGLELEGKMAFGQGWQATAAYTYMDAKVLSDNVSQTNVDLTGKTPTNTPQHMASIWLSRSFDQGAMAGWTFGGGLRYVGKMSADDQNTRVIPSYTLADAMVSYDLGQASTALSGAVMQINVSNLTDSQAVGGCWNANYCEYVEGRRISASFNMRF